MSEETNTTPVVATKRINGEVAPGTIVVPATVAELDELRALHAVRDCTEAETALHEQMVTQAAAAPVKRPSKADLAADAEAAAAAEAKLADDTANAIG